MTENVVGEQKGVLHRQRSVDGGEQAIVRDDDERVDVLAQTFDGFQSLVVPLTTFKLERHGDDAHGQNTGALGNLRDDGRRAGARTTTHTRGNEHHIRTCERLLDGRSALLRSLLTNLRVPAGAQTSRELGADLQVVPRIRRRRL